MLVDHIVAVIGLLALVAVAAFLISQRYARRSEQADRILGVRADQVVAADVDAPVVQEGRRETRRETRSVPKLLESRRLGLVGKPDYVVVDEEGFYRPVELKDRRASEPRASEAVQVMAYCLLLEENDFPTRGGEIQCRNGSFDIPYGPGSRQQVLGILEDMRRWQGERTGDIPQNCGPQCRNCQYRLNCAAEEAPRGARMARRASETQETHYARPAGQQARRRPFRGA